MFVPQDPQSMAGHQRHFADWASMLDLSSVFLYGTIDDGKQLKHFLYSEYILSEKVIKPTHEHLVLVLQHEHHDRMQVGQTQNLYMRKLSVNKFDVV